jgi:hypothetical protein
MAAERDARLSWRLEERAAIAKPITPPNCKHSALHGCGGGWAIMIRQNVLHLYDHPGTRIHPNAITSTWTGVPPSYPLEVGVGSHRRLESTP